MNVPNLISLVRLAAVPLAVWAIGTGRFAAAFWIFVGAGVSDAIDGWLARALNQRTPLGAYLDAIADKLLVVCVFVTLGQVGKIDSWLVILVVSRDVMIVGGIILLFLIEHRIAIEPSFISKANTVVQIAFAGLVLARHGLDVGGAPLTAGLNWAAYVVALTTLFSGAHYVAVGLRHLAAAGNEKS